MREIKFRGKRKDNGEWVYGYYFYNKNKKEHFIISKENELFSNGILNYGIKHIFPIIPETVGQYVGLKDINKQEIYEGDIVKYSNPTINKKYKIIFKKGCYYAKNNEIEYLLVALHSFVEVVSNIYENPELLK